MGKATMGCAKMNCFMQDGDEGWPPVKTKRSCFRSGARQVNQVPIIKLHTNSGIGVQFWLQLGLGWEGGG